ncbi:MAG: MFS transporter [Devosia sp. 67-54]|uniref:RsmB/NOP family class I SAM-dependent RNA methyltransferase n=1 Tax=unclassified Devosia TaxID=196773 RepID=UPI0009687437|nr:MULTISPECIES: RsmB/NOP family class I SAM-dependent RNA methyltransferase [unclassified Devosia]MBN9307523.1 RsmB/NOP family class I SAM-dependent RNA methyltransferase [Devosia sp.]OJX19900.1 MAG: MFS transporter [Devosia sp. 67-54]
MRLPGRLSAAIEVLDDIDRRHRPVAEALKSWGLNNRFAGAGDRAAIGNLVYDALRRRASHAFAMGEDTPRALVLGVAVRDWGSTPEELNDLFAADAHAPAILSADEVQRLSRHEPWVGAPGHVIADLPDWAVPSLEKSFGANWINEGRALAGRPPLDLRVNTLRADRARVLKALERFGAEPTDIAPHGLRIAAGTRDSRTPNVQVEEGYLKGWFEVQDQGSQIVAALAGATAGEQVLDLCAGAGGKTLAMAADMANKGQIFAYDSDRHRLAPIYDRLKRNGARNVQVRAPGDSVLDDLAGRMDRVVIDAPCTGSGTWRRRPDAKWKLTAEQLAARAGEQAAILADGARYVRPGGTLVYITCSVLDEENSRQVAAFLAGHADFDMVPMAPLLESLHPGAENRAHVGPYGVLLTPLRTGTDGFFVSLMRRLPGL